MLNRGWGSYAWIGAFALLGCGSDKQSGSPQTLPDGGSTASGGPSAHPSQGTSAHGSQSTPLGPSMSPPNGSNGPSGSSSTVSGNPSATGSGSAPQPARIETRLSRPESAAPLALRQFRAGAATAASLSSLKYYIRSIQVCETLQAQGSGFQNANGCLELYHGDENVLSYDLDEDWTPLGVEARAQESGFVDLMDADSRSAIGGSTQLNQSHVRQYNYGIITWALPIKVKASVDLGSGEFLYTHDGMSTSELVGVDMIRDYFTEAGSTLLTGPAEEAVVLLPNGGNWFKFQQPLEITADDIDSGRNWVLDLVFNPDGIVKGYEGDHVGGNLREYDVTGDPVRGIMVPMIDLVPVPHRETEHVLRESYEARLDVDSNQFDLRLELYSIEGDTENPVLGVDVKTLVTSGTRWLPPDASKISYVVTGDAGTDLAFASWSGASVITGFQRVSTPGMTTHAGVVCANSDNPAAGEGGAAIVVGQCPAPTLDVEFRLVSRGRLDGLPVLAPMQDAGAPVISDAGEWIDASDAGQALTSDAANPVDAALTPFDASQGSEDAQTIAPDAQ